MKNTIALMMALGLALPAMTLAQDGARPPRRDNGGQRNLNGDAQQRPPANRDGAPGFEGRRPVPPLMNALDANQDGVIDESEIKNASEALRKMDKNGDGKLTMEELRPQRPDGAGPDAAPRPEGNADGARPPRRGPGSPEGQ